MKNQKTINLIERIFAFASSAITIYMFLFVEEGTLITLKTVFLGVSTFLIGIIITKKQTENTIIDYASRFRILEIFIGFIFIILPLGLDILLGVQNWERFIAETPSTPAGFGGFVFVFCSVIALLIIYAIEFGLLYDLLIDGLREYYNGRIDFQNKKMNNFSNSNKNEEEKDEKKG